MFLSERREFPSTPCIAEKRKTLMTVRVSMLLKSRTSLTCFRACFLPGRAKILSASRYIAHLLDKYGKIRLNTFIIVVVKRRGFVLLVVCGNLLLRNVVIPSPTISHCLLPLTAHSTHSRLSPPPSHHRSCPRF